MKKPTLCPFIECLTAAKCPYEKCLDREKRLKAAKARYAVTQAQNSLKADPENSLRSTDGQQGSAHAE